MKKSGIILFLLIIIIAGIILTIDYLMEPVNPEDPELLVVSRGSSVRNIGRKLEEEGWIKSRKIFELYVLIFDYQGQLQAGTYEFEPGDDVKQIVDKLVQGDVANYSLTIPEGFTVEEIIIRITATGLYQRDELETALQASRLERDYMPEQEDVKWKLEGFLYPDTYTFEYGIEPIEIFNAMLSRFENRWLEDLQEVNMDYSINELVTIASMVEKEARLEEEMNLISGVIYNRLNRQMALQLDATVQYALPARVERVFYNHLELESPYNTYRVTGLPPGPIANPGSQALTATVNPEDSDYLFYFARSDGSHVFSETYEEHLRRQRELR
ncbi:MAG: endolytic transglycosylase MltG [Bacillota bacterium]